MRKSILKIASQTRATFLEDQSLPRDLEGYCADLSEHLLRELMMHRIDATFVRGVFYTDRGPQPHCWLEIKCEILDLTATQFSDKVKEHIPDIIAGTYAKNPRYEAIKRY